MSIQQRVHKAFSLIELLVVISIIALLVSILLPALKGAREAARTVICQSNMKQIAYGYSTYANDYKGRIWESVGTDDRAALLRYWWASGKDPLQRVSNSNPAILGPAIDYIGDSAGVLACPSNKRQRSQEIKEIPNYPYTDLSEAFREQLQIPQDQLFTDYTMGFPMSGVPLGTSWRAALRPQSSTGDRGWNPNQPTNKFVWWMPSLPIYFEEDVLYDQSSKQDGLFGKGNKGAGEPGQIIRNDDLLTNRHNQYGHIAYLDGQVKPFKALTKNQQTQDDPGVFCAARIWFRAPSASGNLQFIQNHMYNGWLHFGAVGDRVPYGWMQY